MRYFNHDTSAIDDEKLAEVIMKFGYEGYGLFWAILEKLAKQEKPIKTEVLKRQLNVGKRLDKCWKFLEEIGVINTSNGETFNKQIVNYAGNYLIKKEKNSKRISEWRERQKVTENVTCNEQVRNGHVTPLKGIKENRIKEKEEKEILFDAFYDAYDKKVGKADAVRAWMKIDTGLMPEIIKKAKQFVGNMKDRQYQPHPASWLNGKRWEDEPLPDSQRKNGTHTAAQLAANPNLFI